MNLKFAQALSSKTSAVDDPVEFILSEDLKAGDTLIAKAGSKALGIVSNFHKAGMMGKGGELNVRLDYVKTDSGRIRLRGPEAEKEKAKSEPLSR